MLRLDEIAVDTFVRNERIDAVARYSEALGLHEDYLDELIARRGASQ